MPALWLCAGFFLAMGVVALAAPQRVLAYFDITVVPVAARNEVRAVYGGFGIALGILLVLAPLWPTFYPGIVLTAAVALLGMAGGRLAGWALDRRFDAWPRRFLFLELALAGLLLTSRSV